MVARVSQWLSFRSNFADWKTNRQTESENAVRLENQEEGLVDHPLPMGRRLYPIGLLVLGMLPVELSKWMLTGFASTPVPNPVPTISNVMTWWEQS